jgi:DME family drug/metabolite transporter
MAAVATARAPLLGLGAACGAAFLWGTGALVVNLLVGRFAQSAENISFWRFVVGALVLLLAFGRGPVWRQLPAHAGTLLLAGAAMALYVLCWFLAIERIGASVPTLVSLCLPPVLVTLLAVLRGRERLDAALGLWLLAALVGTVLVVGWHGAAAGALADVPTATRWEGIALAVASGTLYAGFALISGRLSRDLGAGPSAMGLTVVAAAVMGLAAAYTPLSWPGQLPPEIWLLYLGLVTAAVALLAFNWGAAQVTPTTLTVASLVEPLTAVALAALLLGERLQALQWLGAVLMLLAIAGLGRREARRSMAA